MLGFSEIDDHQKQGKNDWDSVPAVVPDTLTCVISLFICLQGEVRGVFFPNLQWGVVEAAKFLRRQQCAIWMDEFKWEDEEGKGKNGTLRCQVLDAGRGCSRSTGGMSRILSKLIRAGLGTVPLGFGGKQRQLLKELVRTNVEQSMHYPCHHLWTKSWQRKVNKRQWRLEGQRNKKKMSWLNVAEIWAHQYEMEFEACYRNLM